MKIAILYICTGKYNIFWKDFYLSCEKYFITNAEKQYFVFTDSDKIYFEDSNKNIHKIYQKNLGWPDNTLRRFEMFLKIKESAADCDFTFFFNGNSVFIEKINGLDFLPGDNQKYVACAHPGFIKKDKASFHYERNSKSTAFINYGEGVNYFAGGINGGITKDFFEAAEIMNDNIKIDDKNNIVAIWHDESHWNKFLLDKNDQIKILSPSYMYPEGFSLDFVSKIVLRKKNIFGDLSKIRGSVSTIKLNKSSVFMLLNKIINKVKYIIFSFLDDIFCSKFFIRKIRFNRKRGEEKRSISIAITSYNREKIILKSLKNIIDDERISEIVILDDGSNEESFKATKKVISGLSPKINFFRRGDNFGVLPTKIQAVNLCSNDWVILLDSDNTLNYSYLNSIFKIKDWDANFIYSASFAFPLLNFKQFSGKNLDFDLVKDTFVHNSRISLFMNDGNFFFNKKRFIDLVDKYKFFNVSAADIIFINYLWLSNGGIIKILPNTSYLHRVHKNSIWKETQEASNSLFVLLKNKILISEKLSFDDLKLEIGEIAKPDSEIIKIDL